MPLQSTGKISAYDGREEALKSTWKSPNYPTIPSPQPQLSVPFFTSPNTDVNGMTGLNPDGTWTYAKMFGWDTWKRPTITDTWMHQYTLDQNTGTPDTQVGVRLHWKVTYGDPFRSAFLIYRSQTKSDVEGTIGVGATLVAIVQHGSENPYTFHKTPSALVPYIKVVSEDLNWRSFSVWGDYFTDPPQLDVDYQAPSNGIWNTYTDIPNVQFSFVDTGVNGSLNGTGPFYYSIQAVDGRANDELGRDVNGDAVVKEPGTYDLNKPSTASYGAATTPKLFTPRFTGVAGANSADSGNGGIIIFSELINSTVWFNEVISNQAYAGGAPVQLDGTSFIFQPGNQFHYYTQGTTPKLWAYLSAGSGKTIDNGTSEPEGGTLTQFDDTVLESWYEFIPNQELGVTGANLSTSSDYRLFIAPYNEGSAPPATVASEYVIDFSTAGSPSGGDTPPDAVTNFCQSHGFRSIFTWNNPVPNIATNTLMRVSVYGQPSNVLHTEYLGNGTATEWRVDNWDVEFGITSQTVLVEVIKVNGSALSVAREVPTVIDAGGSGSTYNNVTCDPNS